VPAPLPAPSPAPPRLPPAAATGSTESGDKAKDAKAEDQGGDAAKAKVPQVTAFPELTQGVGKSETLLQE
jgi:hypothetical protein